MKKKKGISLIVLIITIIVVIILAVTVILTVTKNNPIESAKEAVFKEDVRAFQDELNMYISNEYTRLQGQRDIKITAKKYEKNGGKDSVYTYIPDFKKKYEGKLAIKDDMIVYVGSDAKEKEWLLNSGVYIAKTLTVKYVDQDGNKLKEDESIPLMDNYYSVDVPEIEGYIRFSEKLEGKISQDIEVIAEYYLENDNLAFMGLDASGKETTDEASIVSYEVTGIGECNVSKIAIPREHNSKPVIKIKANAFNGNRTLVSVIIQDSIENIGLTAFQRSSIMTASINASTTGNYIFLNAASLKKVIIGENVTSLGGNSFLNCNKLDDLTILTEKADINNLVLDTTVNLKEIKVNKENSKYMVEDEILFSKDGSKIYAYPTGKVEDTYKIPSNVKEIGNSAFYDCRSLKNIDIPSTVEKIGTTSFQGSSIMTASINASTTGNYIFLNAASLKKVIIGENVTSLGGDSFSNCNKLDDLTILTEKADINNGILGSAGSLKEVKTNEENSKYMVEEGVLFSKDGSKIYAYPTGKVEDIYKIPSNVKEIGNSAFYGCRSLKNIDIPSTVEKVGLTAFRASSIITASINASTTGNYIFLNAASLKKVIIGENVTSLGGDSFSNCNKLDDLTILTEKADINNGILGSAGSLKEVKTNEENSKYMVEEGVLFSKDGSKIYAYPTGKVEDIYKIPSNVKEIGNSAFYGCRSLKNIDIPSTVEKVGLTAFRASSIITASINASTTENYIFLNAASLEKVIIGENVTSLGGNSFSNCSKLKSINYLGTMDEWNGTLGKTSSWRNGNTSIKKIICSDGEITL